ncbi:MAG: response regulator [Myxococcota bacterium]
MTTRGSKMFLPCLEHPVTVTLVDDNPGYMLGLAPRLDQTRFHYLMYKNPHRLLADMNAAKEERVFGQTIECLKHNRTTGDAKLLLHLSQVHQDIYRLARYKQRAILLLDFDFDEEGFDGLELCRQLKSPFVHIILLTGALGEKQAIDAINQGLIDQYILKYVPDFVAKINAALIRGAHAYFRDVTNMLHGLLAPFAAQSALNSMTASSFLRNQMEEHGFREHYLCDPRGTQLLLKPSGDPHGLHLMTDPQIEQLLATPQASRAPASLVQDLRAGRLMLCISNPDEPSWLPPGDEWPNYARKAHPLVLDAKLACHYALVRGSILVDENRIATFDDYKKQHPLGKVVE